MYSFHYDDDCKTKECIGCEKCKAGIVEKKINYRVAEKQCKNGKERNCKGCKKCKKGVVEKEAKNVNE